MIYWYLPTVGGLCWFSTARPKTIFFRKFLLDLGTNKRRTQNGYAILYAIFLKYSKMCLRQRQILNGLVYTIIFYHASTF